MPRAVYGFPAPLLSSYMEVSPWIALRKVCGRSPNRATRNRVVEAACRAHLVASAGLVSRRLREQRADPRV